MKDYLKSEEKPKLISNQDIAKLSKLNDDLTERNFILFKTLILDSIVCDDEPAEEGKYSVTTYRLTNSSMPSIAVSYTHLTLPTIYSV